MPQEYPTGNGGSRLFLREGEAGDGLTFQDFVGVEVLLRCRARLATVRAPMNSVRMRASEKYRLVDIGGYGAS